jgi:hypothetical protein
VRVSQKGRAFRMSRLTREPISVTLQFDSAEMARRGKIGAHRLHATHDSRDVTAAARASFLSRFERQVDPAFELPLEERARRASHARRAYFAKLARLSAISRSRKAKHTDTSEATEAKEAGHAVA